ncbi:MAG: SIS domain-containing protein [Acidobacteriia bacterium]|nr:SIS domain-containing protein [Terriglobia bacterium]
MRKAIDLSGRGPSSGSVSGGALFFHETAKAPAAGMLAGSFRHGPVELVDKKLTAVVFAPGGRTRNLIWCWRETFPGLADTSA